MISNILRNCRRLQRPLYIHLFNQTEPYRIFHLSQHKSSHHQVPGNVWGWNWWHKFWRSWAPVPTLFGLTIFIVWQYSRRLQHRYINDTCSTASQLEVQCYRTIPLRFLSRSWGRLSQVQIPTQFRKFFYMTFSKTYGINLDEVKDDLTSYASLGEFFIRQLKYDARPIASTELVSPADGTVLNCGRVTSCCVEQVKGTTYLIKSFLGDNTWSSESTNKIDRVSVSLTVGDESLNALSSQISYIQAASDTSVFDINRNEYFSRINQIENDPNLSNYTTGGDLFSYKENQGSNLDKQKYGKTKCKKYLIEIPVVPKLLDYYVKDILQTIYSSVSFLAFKTSMLPKYYNFNLMTRSDSYPSLSTSLKVSDGSKAPICTPSAEEEWKEYKKHLLKNPVDNDLYQIIVYLAPGDYHRFHSPAETSIHYRRHFQGDLLSVNPCIACWIPDLFVLNERAAYMGTWKHGFFSMVMVGATNVGSIKVHCDETLLTNSKRWSKNVRHKDLKLSANWKKGAEVGEFRMGSTVVLLFEAPKCFEFNVSSGDKIKVGQNLMKDSGPPSSH